MDINNKKNTIRKLMQDGLSEEERMTLMNSRSVTERMQKQWNDAPDAACLDHQYGSRIWNNVKMAVWDKAPSGKVVFFKIYSLVASILLLLGIVGSVYLLSKKELVTMNVVSSGILNMQSALLPDGTVVQLGSGSKLSYPEKFSGDTREVILDGQAFFDVAKDPGKPFIVHTSSMDVEALGTAFELFCYEIENKSEAILLNGKIRVNLQGLSDNKLIELVLSPDEKIVVDKQSKEISRLKVDADKYTAWRKQRILSFENEKLSMIIPRLEQWYGRKIICQVGLAEQYRFTFKIRDESLERILSMISKSSMLKYTITDSGDYILNIK